MVLVPGSVALFSGIFRVFPQSVRISSTPIRRLSSKNDSSVADNQHEGASMNSPDNSVVPDRRVDRLFLKPEVQKLLKMIAGRKPQKVYRKQPLRKLETSEIKLLTQEELDKLTEEKLLEMERLLEMPPVMSPRVPCEEVLEEEPLLAQFDKCKHVFTDITYGVKTKKRYIVIRETNGILRTANWAERDKMNQIYFPVKGREIDFPALFLDENLEVTLKKGFHEYILDRACLQFEPDDPEFIRVCKAVYDSLDQARNYSVLDSTRHMGGFVFHLAINRNVDNFLIHLLKSGSIDGCMQVLRLLHLLHKEDESDHGSLEESDPVASIKKYISSTSQGNGNLELALQAYQENLRMEQQEQSQQKSARLN